MCRDSVRVLHIIESLEFGGAEKVLVELVNNMADRCDLGICCIKRTGELQSSLDGRVRVYCMNKGEGNHYGLPVQIAKLIREGGYEVVHSHAWGVYVESALAALLARSRVLVHTVHGHYLHKLGSSPAKVLVRHMLERMLAHVHRKIVTVSDAIQEYVRSEVGIPVSRMMTIHNGIDEAPLPSRTERTDDALGFITVGRLAVVKNYPLLLRAFAQVVRVHPGCWLQIVGDGSERNALERLARELKLSASVSFLGFQKNVAWLLAQSDVFVLSSRYEGISIAVLEAMRAGLPVIATRVGGTPEVVVDGETGILVPDGDAAAMVRAMEQLIASPAQRRHMGEQGHAHMHREFAIHAIADKYFSLYTI